MFVCLGNGRNHNSEHHGGGLTKIKKHPWNIFKNSILQIRKSNKSKNRKSMYHFVFVENSSTSFVIIKCEDEDRKRMKIG